MQPLVHLLLIWAGVLIAATAAKKTRLTPVLFFLFVGFVMVNLGIIPEVSGSFVREFSELGIILIMFALGFEVSADDFIKNVKKSWGIAFFGALVPFSTAFLIADLIWHDSAISLMCGLTMTATAVSLTMVSLRSVGLAKSVVATRIMTSAVIDDVGTLVMVAILVPLATGVGEVTLYSMAFTVSKALLFFVIVTIIGAWIFPHQPKGWIRRVPLIGRIGVRHLLTFDEGRYATLVILLVALTVGLTASYFGFHPAVGAYMAGLIIREEYFTIGSRPSNPALAGREDNIYRETKTIINNAAFSWIGPVFFVDLGAKIIFDSSIFIEVLPYAFVMFIGVFVMQVASAGLAARYTSGMNPSSSLMIGFGMLGRAELAFVVMDIAYVQHSILTTQTFFTLMIAAFFLNVSVPLTIAWWQPYYKRNLENGQST